SLPRPASAVVGASGSGAATGASGSASVTDVTGSAPADPGVTGARSATVGSGSAPAATGGDPASTGGVAASTVGCFRFRRRSHERLGLAVVAGARSDRAGSDRVADSGRSTRVGPASAPAAGRPGPTRVDQAVSDASGPPIGPVVAGSSSAGP